MPFLQRKEAGECLRTKEVPGQTSEVTPYLESSIQAPKGGGQSLPAPIRTFFESCFVADFAGVRLHTDAAALKSVRAINGRAYTLGRNIVLDANQYSIETDAGKRLLAHELAHVVQQQSGLAPNTVIQRLTLEERREDLKSEPLKYDQRLQKAFDNNPLMWKGEVSEGVKKLQRVLRDLGYPMPISFAKTGNADGIFGNETYKTVLQFQSDNSLKTDGVVGRETLHKLDEVYLTTPPSVLPPCPKGMHFIANAESVTYKHGITCQIKTPAPALRVSPPIPPPPAPCPKTTWPPAGWMKKPTKPSYNYTHFSSHPSLTKLKDSYREHDKDKSYLANGFYGRNPKCPAYWPKTLWEALDIAGRTNLDVID